MAFLGIGKKKQAKSAQAAQATIDKLISSGAKLDDASVQTAIFASDGKITAKEKKLIKQTTRQASRSNRTALRSDARKTAYENGINPSAPWAQALGSLGSSAAQAVVGVSASRALSTVGTAVAKGRSSQVGQDSLANSQAYRDLQDRMTALESGAGNNTVNYDYGSSDVSRPTDGNSVLSNTGQSSIGKYLIIGAVAIGAFFLLGKRRA